MLYNVVRLSMRHVRLQHPFPILQMLDENKETGNIVYADV